MLKNILVVCLILAVHECTAAFVPAPAEKQTLTRQETVIHLLKTCSVEEIELLTGKKFSKVQQRKIKKAQQRLSKSKAIGIFPERDELTEGFQVLPFFGSISRDRNALRWAGRGIVYLSTAITVAIIIILIVLPKAK